MGHLRNYAPPKFKNKNNLIILTSDANPSLIFKTCYYKNTSVYYPTTNEIFQSAMACLDCAMISFSHNLNVRRNRHISSIKLNTRLRILRNTLGNK